MEPGAHRDGMFPDLRPVGEQIHPAPSSRVARWLRCGGSHRSAGENPVLRQRGPPPARFSLLDVNVISSLRWAWGLLPARVHLERLMLAEYSSRAGGNSK